MVFPANEIDEESSLEHHKTSTGNAPIFKGKHMTTMEVNSGLYKTTPGYARTVLVTEVSKDSIIVFVCSSSPRDSAKRSNTHRWVAIEGSPVLPKQPPKPIRCTPEGSLSLDPKKEVYICFTHALELTPVGQGEGLLPESMPANAHISIPWHPDRTTLNVANVPDPDMQFGEYLIKCGNDDFPRILAYHADYWHGGRYDDKNAYLPAQGGVISARKEEEDDGDQEGGKRHNQGNGGGRNRTREEGEGPGDGRGEGSRVVPDDRRRDGSSGTGTKRAAGDCGR
jgi:hypothetical protein